MSDLQSRSQNQLAADAVSQMQAQLTPQGKTQLDLESQINPEAYDEYLQGRFSFIRRQGKRTKPYRIWSAR